MGASDLLQSLRAVGLQLTLTAESKISVAPRQLLTDELRAAIRAGKEGLLKVLRADALANVTRPCANPLMTADECDRCHAGAWSDTEIELFFWRETRFIAFGRQDAEYLAERLTLRDREADDRRLCVECLELDRSGRCHASRRGIIPGVGRRLEPVQNLLMRCEAFSPALTSCTNPDGDAHAANQE